MSDWLDRRAAKTLNADLNYRLRLAGMGHASEVRAIIKDSPEALVGSGTFEGQPAVFKIYRTPTADQDVTNAAAGLRQYSARLRASDVAVVSVLAKAPEVGLLVMEEAQGTLVSRLLGNPKIDQKALMQRVARWLLVCSGDDFSERRLAPNKFLKPLEEQQTRLSDGDRSGTIGDLLQALKQQRPALRGRAVLWAPSHGDFAPVNMSDDGERLTTFDVQGFPTLPLVRVAAHFLVAKDLTRAVKGPLNRGLDAQTTNTFLQALGPNVGGDTQAIRFFVGLSMLKRLLGDDFKGKGRANALLRVKNYLEDSRD